MSVKKFAHRLSFCFKEMKTGTGLRDLCVAFAVFL
jgi:hypothetical protein